MEFAKQTSMSHDLELMHTSPHILQELADKHQMKCIVSIEQNIRNY